jgi:hypothetical protein
MKLKNLAAVALDSATDFNYSIVHNKKLPQNNLSDQLHF